MIKKSLQFRCIQFCTPRIKFFDKVPTIIKLSFFFFLIISIPNKCNLHKPPTWYFFTFLNYLFSFSSVHPCVASNWNAWEAIAFPKAVLADSPCTSMKCLFILLLLEDAMKSRSIKFILLPPSHKPNQAYLTPKRKRRHLKRKANTQTFSRDFKF